MDSENLTYKLLLPYHPIIHNKIMYFLQRLSSSSMTDFIYTIPPILSIIVLLLKNSSHIFSGRSNSLPFVFVSFGHLYNKTRYSIILYFPFFVKFLPTFLKYKGFKKFTDYLPKKYFLVFCFSLYFLIKISIKKPDLYLF